MIFTVRSAGIRLDTIHPPAAGMTYRCLVFRPCVHIDSVLLASAKQVVRRRTIPVREYCWLFYFVSLASIDSFAPLCPLVPLRQLPVFVRCLSDSSET